jgi:protein-disulfide isomerase
MDRRRFVASLGAAGTVGLTGCLGGQDGEGDTVPLGSHPVSEDLDDQPSIGDSEAETAIVAFEDPSCHSCHSFEMNVLPTMREEMIETGETRFYYRLFTVPVQEWGTDASKALEATYASDEAAFWELKRFYYEEFDFSTDDVLPRTREFLADTAVDADAVIEGARNGEFDDEVDSDRSVGEEAGVQGTPTFFLIDGDEVVASVVGPQSTSVFRNALGV